MPIRSPMDTRPTVVAFAGRRIDAEGAQAARFPFANVGAVRAAIGASLERIAPYLLIASAACGADLMALQAAASGHIRMRIVLPFPRRAFARARWSTGRIQNSGAGSTTMLSTGRKSVATSLYFTVARTMGVPIRPQTRRLSVRQVRRPLHLRRGVSPSSPGMAPRTEMKTPPRNSLNWRNKADSLSCPSRRSTRSRLHGDGGTPWQTARRPFRHHGSGDKTISNPTRSGYSTSTKPTCT